MAAPFSMYQVGAEAMLPPREITLSQWSDENVVLAGTAAAERGQWQTRPYQREPMDVLSPSHPCKQVTGRCPRAAREVVSAGGRFVASDIRGCYGSRRLQGHLRRPLKRYWNPHRFDYPP
jgi:hypothetical protein